MKNYLLTLIAVSLAASLVRLLCPEGERGGLAKHMHLVSSLVLICVLLLPLGEGISLVQGWINGDIRLPLQEDGDREEQRAELEQVLDAASADYFCRALAEDLERQFALPTGSVHCTAAWQRQNGKLAPTRVTVRLSGAAVWCDPYALQDYVSELLGCECVTAIE